MSAPPDHYSVLGVSSDATAADVAARARRVRTELHPDKFSRDVAAQHSAEAAFKRASDAFEVLGDSASRAIYDRFGHDGVQEARQLGLVGKGTALSTSLRSPAETVEKYALNRRLRKEKELASDLGIGGNMSLRLDAARLFALPGCDMFGCPSPATLFHSKSTPRTPTAWSPFNASGGCAILLQRRDDESLTDRLSAVEVSSMDMGSNVYIPLGERDTGFVSSQIGVRGNGTGGGNFIGVWTRQWTPNRSSDVTLVVGDSVSLGGRTAQVLNPLTKGIAGLTLAGNGLTTLLGGERELCPGLISKLQVELSDTGAEWATELNYSPEARYRIKNNFKINPIQLSWLSEWAYQFSPLTRVSVRGSVALPSLAQLAQIRGRAMYHFFNYPLKMLRCEILARHVSGRLNATHTTCTLRAAWPLLTQSEGSARLS
jgi:curved DNA-binding protein CbpA